MAKLATFRSARWDNSDTRSKSTETSLLQHYALVVQVAAPVCLNEHADVIKGARMKEVDWLIACMGSMQRPWGRMIMDSMQRPRGSWDSLDDARHRRVAEPRDRHGSHPCHGDGDRKARERVNLWDCLCKCVRGESKSKGQEHNGPWPSDTRPADKHVSTCFNTSSYQCETSASTISWTHVVVRQARSFGLKT